MSPQLAFLSFPAQDEPPAKKSRVNPQVYMDIKIGNKPAGRLRILLRSDVVPMTAGEEKAQPPLPVPPGVAQLSPPSPLPPHREFPLPLHPRERIWLQRQQLPPRHPPVHVPGRRLHQPQRHRRQIHLREEV